jgi:glucose-6-phosphate isomerase
MLTKNLTFENFVNKKVNLKLKKYLNELISSKNEVINSLSKGYKYSYTKKSIKKLKGYKDIRIFGMGGSSLGTLAIYDFLKHKINKNFYFLTNLNQKIKFPKKKYLNLVISKSGNTLETIVNSNLYINKNDKNVLVSDNKKSILREISMKLKSDIIDHNNFIGGRYSVLSEVGMLPAELMGLDSRKFKKFDNLVANKKFLNSLIINVSNILELIKRKKFNSVILNYDETTENFLKWYQQLVAESLGKKGNGIFPIISNMPKDNHSYQKLNQDIIPGSLKFLKKKNLGNILHSKILATKKVFQKKKIPFRSFYLKSKNEEVLGELFTYFILETILLAKALKINPYDQPAVELIKVETKKILKSS